MIFSAIFIGTSEYTDDGTGKGGACIPAVIWSETISLSLYFIKYNIAIHLQKVYGRDPDFSVERTGFSCKGGRNLIQYLAIVTIR
jgi:hypothetical protein